MSGLKSLGKTLYRRWDDHAVSEKAAQLSYYFLFALFPFLFFLVTLAAFLPISGAVENLVEHVSYVMPDSAVELIRSHLDSLLHKPKPKLLTLGFLVAFWSASRGVDAIRNALNLAYDVKESRPYWKTQLSALLMTLLGTLLVILALTMMVLGGKAGLWLASKVGLGPEYSRLLAYLRWPLTAFLLMWALSLTYYLLPDVKQRFRLVSPGSVVGTILWILATFGFTQYAEHFGNYNVTYGAIGSVIVLLTWLYICGLIFILGGELDAALKTCHPSQDGMPS